MPWFIRHTVILRGEPNRGKRQRTTRFPLPVVHQKAIAMHIGHYPYEEYLRIVESFHNYAAPGVLLGGFMVDLALRNLPRGILFDAVSETPKCLPDAIQLLTPCTIGNGWLRILNLGRYALSLYDKATGDGIRVAVDGTKLDAWPHIRTWLLKTRPKSEQDTQLLRDEIRNAGHDLYKVQPVRVAVDRFQAKRKGRIALCSLCEEPYPAADGPICRGCRGEAPYEASEVAREEGHSPPLRALPLDQAVGKRALHDMTRIVPGESKGPAVLHDQPITVGDLCRLQTMGRRRVYVLEDNPPHPEWVHENEAALAFAEAMAGEGVAFHGPPREGKVNLVARRDGLFLVNESRLERFNLVPEVMCASRKSYTLVSEGREVAGTRAIPLFLSRNHFQNAMAILSEGPLFQVIPLRKARVGILVTGSEVFDGLVEDRFIPIIGAKVQRYDCEVVQAQVVPDDREAIRVGIMDLVQSGADLVVTTAGLSVDPDDVTRLGLLDAGVTEMTYGAPVLPGAMTLLARLGAVQIIGVPACALYFKTTSFDLLLPRLLAGVKISRRDLARLGHGAFCIQCKSCTFPKCPFGT